MTQIDPMLAQDKYSDKFRTADHFDYSIYDTESFPIMPPSSTKVMTVKIVLVKGEILPFDEEDLIFCEVKPK